MWKLWLKLTGEEISATGACWPFALSFLEDGVGMREEELLPPPPPLLPETEMEGLDLD